MNIRAAGMQPAGSNGDGNPSGGTPGPHIRSVHFNPS